MPFGLLGSPPAYPPNDDSRMCARFLSWLCNNWSWNWLPSCFFFLLSMPFVVFAVFSLSLLVVTQIRGHIAGSSSPSTLRTVGALRFHREKISALSSLVGLRRPVLTPTLRRRSQQLILFEVVYYQGIIYFFWQINSRSQH